jgi:PPM family protein phosphatase
MPVGEKPMTMPKWDTYSASVAGRRETNEDKVLVLPLGETGYFIAVADGMGGVKGGEVASAVVLDFARDFLTSRFARPVRADQLKKILRGLYAGADVAVSKAQKANPLLAGMGTTLACILAQGDRYVVGNIGDGRVYRSSEGVLTLLTKDHTYVQEMISTSGTKPDSGVIKKFGHVLTRSIEGGKDKPDIFPLHDKWFTLNEGEGFLLCSDGLILDKGADHESSLESLFVGTRNLKEAAEGMVAFALDAGSTDNISVALATWGRFRRFPERASEPTGRQVTGSIPVLRSPQSRRPVQVTPALVSLVILAVLALVALFVLRSFGHSGRGPGSSRVGTQSTEERRDAASRGGKGETSSVEKKHPGSNR